MAPEDAFLPYAIRQFQIERIVPLNFHGLDISFTNSASAMVATAITITLFMLIGMRSPQLVPGRLQMAAEAIYALVVDTVVQNAGRSGIAHIPFVFTLFVFTFFGGLIGLTPVKFTFTSHLIVTLGLSIIVFTYVTVLGFWLHGVGFLRTFLPRGTPALVGPLIVLIEVIAYLFRPITLGVRLFANVLAGHMIIKLFADFSSMMIEALGAVCMIAAVGPMLMTVIFYGFEIVVLFIQSYIFVLLTCIYIRASIDVH